MKFTLSWLKDHLETEATLEEIGARFSLTRERVRQIKEKAIRRLRHASTSKSLRAYLKFAKPTHDELPIICFCILKNIHCISGNKANKLTLITAGAMKRYPHRPFHMRPAKSVLCFACLIIEGSLFEGSCLLFFQLQPKPLQEFFHLSLHTDTSVIKFASSKYTLDGLDQKRNIS